MQRRMPTPDLNPVHKLLSKHVVSEDLIVVRSSSRAKRLIFKSSLKKGVEIVVPHGAASSWVVEMTQNRIPWIKAAQQHVREGRGQLNPTRSALKADASVEGQHRNKSPRKAGEELT
jgi:predicted metal-dependent hydrolase